MYEIREGTMILEDQECDLSITAPLEPTLNALHLHQNGYEICTKQIGTQFYDEWVSRKGLRSGQYRRSSKKNVLFEAYYKNDLVHGPFTTFYEDGTASSLTWYVEGKKQGKSSTFFRDGKTESLRSYKQGHLHGKQQFYYENGTLKSLLFYENGLLQGQVTLYFENGSPQREIGFCKGMRHGTDCAWNRDGIILFAIEYSDGKEVKVSIPDPVVMLYQIVP